MNAKFLLRKYLNTGEPIPEYQFNKLNPNLRTTYIRKRSIEIEYGQDVRTFEVPYISQDTWIKSLKKNGSNIRYIKNQTSKVQMVAVEEDPRNILDIENPTPEVQMYVVKEHPSFIKGLKTPTDEVQDYILKNHKEYIFHIDNPNDKIKPLLDLEEYQMSAVKKNGTNIKYIQNPTDKVQIYVLEKNQLYIQYIKNPTPKVQMYIVKVHPSYINSLKNPTDEVQDYILDNHPRLIKDIKNPNEKVKQYLLGNNINESRMKILIKESQLKKIINEEVFNYYDLSDGEKKNLYNLFKSSYEKSVGTSWGEEKFDRNARGWKFFGDRKKGFISVRKQNSGLNKLTGVAGENFAIKQGLNDIINLNEPIWGMADRRITNFLVKTNKFYEPPFELLKIIIEIIPPYVFGNVEYVLNDDSITFKYDDVGDSTKYLFGNAQYFNYLYVSLIKNNDKMISDEDKEIIFNFLKSFNN
jgi:hypothetical protein